MSKLFKNIFFTILSVSLLLSCKKPPEWDVEPQLWQLEETEYIVSANKFDTIRLSLSFQDGDGNLGLDSDADSTEPFHPYDIVKDADGNTVFFDETQTFNIYTHEVSDLNGDGQLDTFRVTRNKFRNNIFFTFYRYNQLGELIETLNFQELGDYGLDGFNNRFEPLFKKDFTDEVYEGPMEGVIEYDIVSGFNAFNLDGKGFPAGIYRIGVQICDRDLNVSNEVITTPKIEIK